MTNEDTIMRVPATYRLQHSCFDCQHSVVVYEYDETPECFCSFGALRRPRCGSILMNEHVSESEYHLWEKWSEGRQVSLTGICDEWEGRSGGIRREQKGGVTMSDPTELLTSEEMQHRLRIGEMTLRKWRKDGIVPAIQIYKNVYRYSWPDVLAALRERGEGE